MLAHQLYIVDASLFELLQSSFGLFLQWECKTLESLCTLVQAKLHGDLRDIKVDGKTGKGQYGKSKRHQIWCFQTRARAVGVPIRLRSSIVYENTRESSKTCLQQKEHTVESTLTNIPAKLYPAETRENNTHQPCNTLRPQHSSVRAGCFDSALPPSL